MVSLLDKPLAEKAVAPVTGVDCEEPYALLILLAVIVTFLLLTTKLAPLEVTVLDVLDIVKAFVPAGVLADVVTEKVTVCPLPVKLNVVPKPETVTPVGAVQFIDSVFVAGVLPLSVSVNV